MRCNETVDTLKQWLGASGSTKVSRCINEMISFALDSRRLANGLIKVVEAGQERRRTDKQINDSWLSYFMQIVFKSYEQNIQKAQRRIKDLESRWLHEKERMKKQGTKLYLRRMAISSDLLSSGVIACLPTDEQLSEMMSPPQI